MKYLKSFEQKNITLMNLTDQNLTELLELPKNLKYLDCHNNQLTKLTQITR